MVVVVVCFGLRRMREAQIAEAGIPIKTKKHLFRQLFINIWIIQNFLLAILLACQACTTAIVFISTSFRMLFGFHHSKS